MTNYIEKKNPTNARTVWGIKKIGGGSEDLGLERGSPLQYAAQPRTEPRLHMGPPVWAPSAPPYGAPCAGPSALPHGAPCAGPLCASKCFKEDSRLRHGDQPGRLKFAFQSAPRRQSVSRRRARK